MKNVISLEKHLDEAESKQHLNSIFHLIKISLLTRNNETRFVIKIMTIWKSFLRSFDATWNTWHQRTVPYRLRIKLSHIKQQT